MKKDILKNLVDQGLSQRQIALILNSTQTAISRLLRIYNLYTIRSIRREPLYCIQCKEMLGPASRRSRRYCSNKCQGDHQLLQSVSNDCCSPKTAKRYLISLNHRCSVCSNAVWNNLPITLEIDHIDGNSENNKLVNLRLICPNCHSQTSTWKNRNRGNGRHYRRIRYAENKSY